MEWHEDSFFFTEPFDIIIVCIVANQGLPNKIKLDELGLVMSFIQVNDGKVSLYTGPSGPWGRYLTPVFLAWSG